MQPGQSTDDSDGQPQASLPDGLPQPRRAWALSSMVMAITMAAMGGTMLNLALPAMAREFAVDPADVIWVVSAYQLVIAILLFPMGALGERIGHGAVYAGGLALFTIATLACGVTTSFAALIVARIAQGIGSAAVLSVNIALFRFIFPRRLLGRGISYNTMTVALASSAGPTVASLVLSVAPWQFLFLVFVPLGIAGSLIAWLALPPTPKTPRAFDGTGAGLIAMSVGLLILGLDGIGRRDPWPILAAQFAGSLVFFS
ncbi:MAG: MFS transporter [Alphaproteobacteria bacterium]|nr:MFS transporter [Alphaproteobacteria bacterium]